MKRRLLIIVILLLLGAVVNVAVAWGTMNRLDHSSGLGWDDARSRLVSLVTGAGPSDGDPAEAYLCQSYRAGWPCRSLGAERWVEWSSDRFVDEWRGGWGSKATNIQGFVSVHDGVLILASRFRRPLPYAPIWPGFAINTIFYAAILWPLMYGLSALRRFLRVRRGLCPKCAYPMGESAVCTECGRVLPSPT